MGYTHKNGQMKEGKMQVSPVVYKELLTGGLILFSKRFTNSLAVFWHRPTSYWSLVGCNICAFTRKISVPDVCLCITVFIIQTTGEYCTATVFIFFHFHSFTIQQENLKKSEVSKMAHIYACAYKCFSPLYRNSPQSRWDLLLSL